MSAPGSGEPARRGRRRHRGGSAASPDTSAGDSASPGPAPQTGYDGRADGADVPRPAGRSGNRRAGGASPRGDSPERLAEHRPTQLPPDLAARAREVATPTAADLAAAEAELVLVRRNYVPKDSL